MTLFVEGLSKYREPDKQIRRIGDYDTIEEAVAASKRTIDDFLLREYQQGASADELYEKYQRFGEVPCIFRDDNQTISVSGFNHWEYAKARCAEICGK